MLHIIEEAFFCIYMILLVLTFFAPLSLKGTINGRTVRLFYMRSAFYAIIRGKTWIRYYHIKYDESGEVEGYTSFKSN